MALLPLIVLAIVQGLTEFLPVSSSAHLILAPLVTGWQDQGLAFDVAVHVGTLLAVVLYFRQEVFAMLTDWSKSLVGGPQTANSRLAWQVGIATIPAALVGLLLNDFIEAELRSPLVIAISTIFFGLLLWFADYRSHGERSEYQLAWKIVLFIGLMQALALVPGTSRSGITITAGLLAGLSSGAAARFSFLLSIPIILLAGGKQAVDVIQMDALIPITDMLLAAAISGVFAFLCIKWFLILLEKVGMLPFIIYRLVLGAVLLAVYL